MYIVACHKCGETKIISSITGKNGITSAHWSCPVCGTGQLVEIISSRTFHCGSLRDIIAGIGFASDIENGGIPQPKRKSFPSIYD